MQELTINEIKTLSFPDYPIVDFSLEPFKKQLRIEIEGAWLDIDVGYELGPGEIMFFNWKQLLFKTYRGTRWEIVAVEQHDALKEICEFVYDSDNIILRGFGRQTGLWIEYTIKSSNFIFRFSSF